jgi:hypothetical protein
MKRFAAGVVFDFALAHRPAASRALAQADGSVTPAGEQSGRPSSCLVVKGQKCWIR